MNSSTQLRRDAPALLEELGELHKVYPRITMKARLDVPGYSGAARHARKEPSRTKGPVQTRNS